jgi:hypothetical protein
VVKTLSPTNVVLQRSPNSVSMSAVTSHSKNNDRSCYDHDGFRCRYHPQEVVGSVDGMVVITVGGNFVYLVSDHLVQKDSTQPVSCAGVT